MNNLPGNRTNRIFVITFSGFYFNVRRYLKTFYKCYIFLKFVHNRFEILYIYFTSESFHLFISLARINSNVKVIIFLVLWSDFKNKYIT